MSDSLEETKQRYSIFVPSPSVSLNMGAPNHGAQFGYSGFSVSSSPQIFIDCNKATLFQAGSSSCWQIGGSWTQYSNAHTWINAQEHVRLGSGKNMTIVAGAAGVGQVTALTYRSDGTVKLPPYNNLDLHYRVTEQVSNLQKFFEGKDASEMAPTRGPALANKGLPDAHKTSWTELGLQDYATEVEDALAGDESTYSPISRFKPYPKSKLLRVLMRTRDLIQLGLYAVTDNKYVKKLTQAAAAVQKTLDCYYNITALSTGIKGMFVPGQDDRTAFERELESGLMARVGSAESMGERLSGHASVTTSKGPFDLSDAGTQDYTIETDAENITVTPPTVGTKASYTGGPFPSSEPAVLEASRSTLNSYLKNPDSSYEFLLVVSGTEHTVSMASVVQGSLDSFKQCLTSSGAPIVVVGDNTAASPLQIKTTATGSNATLRAQEVDAHQGALADIGLNTSEHVGAEVSGLTADQSLSLAIDHKPVVHVVFEDSDQSLDDVVARINRYVGFECASAVPSGDDNVIKLESQIIGSSSQVAIIRGSYYQANNQPRDVLTQLGLIATTVDGTPNTLPDGTEVDDLSEVSVSDALKCFDGDTVEAETDDNGDATGAIKISSTSSGSGSEVKEIDEDGTNDLIAAFGLTNKKDRIGYLGEGVIGTGGTDPILEFRSAMFEINKMPEDLRNMGRPLLEALDSAIGAVASAQGALEAAKSIFTKPSPPPPPPSVGLFAQGGVTMGTDEKILGVASGGIVFAATGKLGMTDTKTMIVKSFESKVASVVGALDSDRYSIAGIDSEPDDSLGFRVRSGSVAELTAAGTVEINAIGRKTNSGVGVVRATSSNAIEVCANNNIAIAARAADGAVEVLGETVQIGVQDTGDIAFADVKDSNNTKLWKTIGKQEVTKNVRIAGTEKATITVGSNIIHVTPDDIRIGFAKDDGTVDLSKGMVYVYKDEVDMALESTVVQVKKDVVWLTNDSDTELKLDGAKATVQDSNGAKVEINGGKITVAANSSNSLTVGTDGAKVNGSTIKLG